MIWCRCSFGGVLLGEGGGGVEELLFEGAVVGGGIPDFVGLRGVGAFSRLNWAASFQEEVFGLVDLKRFLGCE